MRLNNLAVLILASAFTLNPAGAAADSRTKVFREARELYDNGMYSRARTLFDSIQDDPYCEAYSVMCSIRLRTEDYGSMVSDFENRRGASSLSVQMHYLHALNLFDEGNYEAARAAFVKTDSGKLTGKQRIEYEFKIGYCDYAMGNYTDAWDRFSRVLEAPKSEYTGPADYLSGCILYSGNGFDRAVDYFTTVLDDARFKDLASFYILDCKFNMKDYAYVVENGEAVYESCTEGRKLRVARILSESFLIKGDKSKAKEYYSLTSREDMTRSDYFYAGNVLYGIGDYKGAIENFQKMTDRSDSLGQIANYQIAGAYMKLRNQVSAMEAFKDAASVLHDPRITEDASFNYAKLAFDLNKDTVGFTEYIKRYSTTKHGDQIYSYMALAALYDHDYARAVDAYDHIDELTPDMVSNYTKANYLRAKQLVSGGSFRNAVPCLRAAAYYLPRTDRLNQLSRYWLAEACYSTDNFGEAARTWQDLYNSSALDGREEGALLPYNLAYAHYGDGDYAQASKWFDVYLRSGAATNREDALVRRADCDFATRNYKDAVKSYQNVIDESGSADNIYPYYQQALCYGLTGDKKKKVEVLSKVENASPSLPLYSQAMYEFGRAEMETGNSSEAVRVFTKLRTTTSDSTYVAKSLMGLGMVNRNIGEYEKAIGYYDQVIHKMPGSDSADDALLAIESIYQTLKTPEKYLEYIENNSLVVSRSEADKERVYYNTAEQVYLAGNYGEAVHQFQRYLEKYPETPRMAECCFYLADSYRVTGNKEKALDYFTKLMSMDSDGPYMETSVLAYADLSYELEHYADAYSGYSKLLSTAKFNTNMSTARVGMMRSAYRNRDYDNAILAADAVKADTNSEKMKREADYVCAKSFLLTSRRTDAMKLFVALSAYPSTPEGAEACYLLIQNKYDTGKFDEVESAVYDFSGKAGDQSYWLAKSFIVLGDSFAERGIMEQAKATFESVRDGYTPSSEEDDVQDNVKMRLERLAQLMKN